MMLHRFATIEKFAAGGAALPDRTVIAIASDETVDRAGDIMVAVGCDATAYKLNPVVLRDHLPSSPVGVASVITKSGRIEASIKFAPQGVSKTADECYALVKAGVLTGVSIGFRPIESEPLRGGGVKFVKWELLEISVVAVPANQNALIIQRSYRARASKAAALGKAWASGLSAADREHAGQVLKCLEAMGQCHVAALDAHRKAAVLHREMRDLLIHFNAHLAKALEHMGKLGQRRGDDDDFPDAPDDYELAALIARRKRLKLCEDMRLAGERFIAVPKAFKVRDTARQVRSVIAHVGSNSQGRSYLPRGMDYQEYLAKSGAVLWEHKDKKPIAWCIGIDVYNDRVEAVAQFPAENVSALADEIFRQIKEGVVTGVSIGTAWTHDDETPKGDVVEIGEYELDEWSFCRNPSQPLARIMSIGGAPVRRAWNDPREPRMPQYGEAGPTAAHFVAGVREYERLKRVAPWVN